MLKNWISRCFFATSFILDRTLHSAPRDHTLSASDPMLPSFTCWVCRVEDLVNCPYWLARSGKKFLYWTQTTVVYVDFGVGQDVGYCKIQMRWREVASSMSRLVHLINLNKASSAFWLLLMWKSLCITYNVTWLVVSVIRSIPGYFSTKTSPDILALEEFSVNIWQSWDFGSCVTRCVPVNTQAS